MTNLSDSFGFLFLSLFFFLLVLFLDGFFLGFFLSFLLRSFCFFFFLLSSSEVEVSDSLSEELSLLEDSAVELLSLDTSTLRFFVFTTLPPKETRERVCSEVMSTTAIVVQTLNYMYQYM